MSIRCRLLSVKVKAGLMNATSRHYILPENDKCCWVSDSSNTNSTVGKDQSGLLTSTV